MRLRLRLKVRVGSGLERASLCWLLATPSSARREGGWHRANSGIGKASTMIDAMRRAERRSYLVRVRVAVRAWVRARDRDRVRVRVRVRVSGRTCGRVGAGPWPTWLGIGVRDRG